MTSGSPVGTPPAAAPPSPPAAPGNLEHSLFEDFQRVALALSAERDLDRLLELILTKCREVTVADAGSLYLVDEREARPGRDDEPTGAALRFAVAQNASRPVDLRAVRLPLTRTSLAGYVALTRQPLNIPDVYGLGRDVEFQFNPRMDQTLDYRTVSMLVIPMVDHTEEVVGVLQVINKKRAPDVVLDTAVRAAAEALPFGPRDQQMVTALASLAAVALRGRRAEEGRLALEGLLRQSQKMEAVGRLAGGVAHDFNNLLMVIRGRSELLLYHVKPDHPLQRHIELIRQTAERAADLTQQLLAFSRRQVLAPRVLDVNQVVTGMVAMLHRLIGEHIELEVVTNASLAHVRADPGQIEQVVMNLVVNARDAMPEGGRLAIRTANGEIDDAFARRHPGARPGRYVVLAVSDSGVGMSEEVKTHLFEPFFTTKQPGRGTGLGLATVYGVIKQHRGYIAVDSEPGQGATFTVYLPWTEAAPGELEPPPTPARIPRGSETVLLVEDEQAVRDLVREILQTHGYTVIEARHGGEALLIGESATAPIDLLLTDVVMPQVGGREVAVRLRRARPELRVLYMSGYPADPAIQDGVHGGAGYVEKPFTADGLARKVRETLDRPPPTSA